MTSALEHRVCRLERELEDADRALLRILGRLEEVEEKLQRDIGESLVDPNLALRESKLAEREASIAAREQAVKEREDRYARAVTANPLPPAHPKDAWLTDLAAGATYLQFVAAGWTDALLEQHRIMVVPR
jgi:hypothetical protein